jgi:hypothetical protein
MLKLAERMVASFCGGVTASAAHQWTTLSGSGAEDVRVMTRKSVDDPGRPPGIVLNAATSFWMPVPPKRVFEFLRDESSRSEVEELTALHVHILFAGMSSFLIKFVGFAVGHPLQRRRGSRNGSHRQWPGPWELCLPSSCQCKFPHNRFRQMNDSPVAKQNSCFFYLPVLWNADSPVLKRTKKYQ